MILPESERANKIRASSIAPTQLISNSSKSISNVFYTNGGKVHNHSKQRPISNGQHNNRPLNELFIQQKHPIQSYPLEIERKNMDFLIPRPPNTAATCQTQATLSNIVAPRFTLNDIKSHLSDNLKIIQSTAATSQKMTKKQLKLAQAQLDKLTQINIHLQGMLNHILIIKFIFVTANHFSRKKRTKTFSFYQFNNKTLFFALDLQKKIVYNRTKKNQHLLPNRISWDQFQFKSFVQKKNHSIFIISYFLLTLK